VWELGVDPGEVLGRELDLDGADVLLEVATPLGAGDRDHVVALRKHPGQSELSRRDPLLAGELLDLGDECEVAFEVLASEAGALAAKVVRVELVGLFEATGEEAAPER
jgi:hypothetical protein